MTAPDPPPPLLASDLASLPFLDRLPPEALERLSMLSRLIAEGNQRLNLTRIEEPRAMAVSHFADSLAVAAAEPRLLSSPGGEAIACADIGTGGGFPLLPLACANPSASWTGIEATGKKAKFVGEAAASLGLARVQMLPARAEDVAGDAAHRERYDFATARAVGSVAALLEVGLPLLKVGGELLLMKTESAMDEIATAAASAGSLGGVFGEPFSYRLPGDRQSRLVARFRKAAPTPAKYPRPGVNPFKKPLA